MVPNRRNADVAQTVEQLIRNQQVSSSILLIGSRIKTKGGQADILTPFCFDSGDRIRCCLPSKQTVKAMP
jgi:hypothetical protein